MTTYIPSPKAVKVCDRYFSVVFVHDPFCDELYAVVTEHVLRPGGSVSKEGAVLERACWNHGKVDTMDIIPTIGEWWLEQGLWLYGMICFGYKPMCDEHIAEYMDDTSPMSFYSLYMRAMRIAKEQTVELNMMPWGHGQVVNSSANKEPPTD